MTNYEPNPAHRGQPATPQRSNTEIDSQDKGQPPNAFQNEELESYMNNLGAGTGVDIGPGAAGEMGGAAQDPNENKEEDLIYPDSGDFPQILPGHHDAP